MLRVARTKRLFMKKGDNVKRYIIVGNGVAAAGCIEGIRTVDKQNEITVISKEKLPVYCRPLISYYLEGKTKPENIGYRGASFYSDNNCTVIYGEEAKMADFNRKTVVLSDNNEIPFSKLCIASGSSPFVPKFKGIETVENKFTFLTFDDALELEKKLSKTARVLIVGAGLIGLKCAEGIFDRVKSITVCDLADRLLSSILDSDTAPFVQKALEKKGINFLLSDSVAEFKGNTAFMNSGKTVEFDLLVCAVGVRANTALAAEMGAEVNRGIKIDEHMQTSLKDVYAAGDCTEGKDISSNSDKIIAIMPNAYIQGFTAGVNMAGGEKIFDNAVPMNSIGFFGVHIMTAGSYTDESDGGKVFCDYGSGFIKKFFVKDGLLKGYILIGSTEKCGIYTSLIREKTPLNTVDFDLLVKLPTFVAFSKTDRRKKFGGVI